MVKSPKREWSVGILGLFILSIATLLAIFGIFVSNRKTNLLVDHIQQVILSTERCFEFLNAAEAAQQTFLLSNDEQYAVAYNDSLSEVTQNLSRLCSLTKDNAAQQRRCDQLDELIRDELTELAGIVRVRRNSGTLAVQSSQQSSYRRKLNNDAGKIVGEIQAEESAVVDRRLKRCETTLDWLLGFAMAGSAIGFFLIVLSARSGFGNAKNQIDRETQFRTLADILPQLCWMANADGWIFWYNQRWFEYTGSTPGQMAGWGWQSVHAPETLPDVLERWRSSIQTGATFEMVFPLRGADGVFRPFLTRAVPVRDRSGKVVRWLGTNTEIGEQQRTEHALRDSEERLRLSQQIARIGTFEWNIKTGLNQWTPELEALYGLPTGGFAGTLEAWQDLVVPEDHAMALEKVRLSMETGGFEAEWRVIWPDKTLRWLSARGRVFKDEQGQPFKMIGVNIDITERKLAEQALRDSEIRYSTLAESLPAIIFTSTPIGKTEYVNSRWTEYTGVTLEQSRREGFTSSMHPEDQGGVDQGWMVALRDQVPYECEFRLRRADGVYRWFHCRARPLRNDDGQTVRWLGISSDVDDEKKSEERLRQAQKMEAVGRLAGGIAHDFNNLLTAISGYNGLLLEQIDNRPELLSYAQEVQGAADRAAELTQQLLTFSRRQFSQPKLLDVNEVVLKMQRLLGRLIGEDIQVTSNLAVGLGQVRIDPTQLDQVIMNLAVNARDAMPQGGTITIETANAPASHTDSSTILASASDYVSLQVRDTGCGMNAETKSRLFEPFFTTKEEGKGTGLGMSIVYGVVQQHGGFVEVESELGAGTAVTIYLPRAFDFESETPIMTTGSTIPMQATTGETVLLVEDESVVRLLASELLRASGYAVIEASTPTEALSLLRAHAGPVNLLVTDVLMPGMRGPELAKCVRALWPSLPVLYISGYSDSTFLDPSVRGRDGFLQKPFGPAALARAVRAALDRPA